MTNERDGSCAKVRATVASIILGNSARLRSGGGWRGGLPQEASKSGGQPPGAERVLLGATDAQRQGAKTGSRRSVTIDSGADVSV